MNNGTFAATTLGDAMSYHQSCDAIAETFLDITDDAIRYRAAEVRAGEEAAGLAALSDEGEVA